MFIQWNSTVKLYPSFSQLFMITLMTSITKVQSQPAQNSFYSVKRSKTQILLIKE